MDTGLAGLDLLRRQAQAHLSDPALVQRHAFDSCVAGVRLVTLDGVLELGQRVALWHRHGANLSRGI